MPEGGARETVILATPASAAGGRVIASPFQFVTTGEDNLRVRSWNSYVGARIAVHGRFLRADGTIVAHAWQQVPYSNRTVRVDDYALEPGALLNLTAFVESGTPDNGQTFIEVQLIRGLSGSTIVLGTLLADYITAQRSIGWPGSPIQSSLDGPGRVYNVTAGQPPFGATTGVVVPAGARWEILNLRTSYQADATGIARYVYAQITLVGSTSVALPVSVTIGPSGQQFVSFIQGGSYSGYSASGRVVVPLPVNNRLPPNATFDLLVTNLQLGDRFGSLSALVREWIDVG